MSTDFLVTFQEPRILTLSSYFEGFCHIFALDEFGAREGGRDRRFPNIQYVLPRRNSTKSVCLFLVSLLGE